MDLLEGVEGPEAGHDVEDAGGADEFFVIEGHGEIFEETEGGVKELRVGSFGEDGDEGFVDVRGVDELLAGVV